jgi:glyoxylase-like metal-dependent hydrolase (beta-lactamase superfamily II)
MLLVDPIVPAPDVERERFWQALDRDARRVGPPRILLTCAWHARSSAAILGRYPEASVWVHADGADRLPEGLVPADTLPGGVLPIDGFVGRGEVLLWLPGHKALVCGDTLLGRGPYGVSLCPQSWLGDADPASVRAELAQRLAGLPVERILPAHGAAVQHDGRAALDGALS